MAKEQDPLLTELEKKIVLFYIQPFLKLFLASMLTILIVFTSMRSIYK